MRAFVKISVFQPEDNDWIISSIFNRRDRSLLTIGEVGVESKACGVAVCPDQTILERRSINEGVLRFPGILDHDAGKTDRMTEGTRYCKGSLVQAWRRLIVVKRLTSIQNPLRVCHMGHVRKPEVLTVPTRREFDLGLDLGTRLVKVEVVRDDGEIDSSRRLAVAIAEMHVSIVTDKWMKYDILAQGGSRQASLHVCLCTHVSDNHLQPFRECRDGNMRLGAVEKVVESVVGWNCLVGVGSGSCIFFGGVKFWNPDRQNTVV